MKLMVLNDPEWKGYRESLYPNPMGMTEILTVQTVRMMQAGGDDVTRSRPVRHWSSFKSSTDAASFVDRVAREGYSRISSTENPSLERPFVVIVGRDDALDPRFSRDSVGWLFNRASECGGKYDGWQAENLSQPSTGAAWGMTT
jgi:hypothetical protein